MFRNRPGFSSSFSGLIAGVILSALAPTVTAQTTPFRWQGVERVIAFADVHGAYAQLHQLLRDTGVIDAQDHWAAGRSHVVSLGDLLDRGAGSRQVMDLLMRLQAEAADAGGQLHVVLGNHEAMNLVGDLRYVGADEFAAYQDLESGTEREAARAAWAKQTCEQPCPAFDTRFPPGYFGHRSAFAASGKYGGWLLGLPAAITINDTLFMHGGPGPVLAGMSLQELDLRYRTELVAAMQDPATAESGLLGDGGPNWYRGTAMCNEASESDVLLPLLAQFGVQRLVVGHTPTRNSRAVTRFDGRVVKLDAGMNPAAYHGRAVALILDAAGMRVQYAGESGIAAPLPEGLFVAPEQVEDAKVQAALRSGTIAAVGPRGPDELEVTLAHEGQRIPAVFRALKSDAAHRESAAWRLDRLLGLGIVPATEEREFQGRTGVLQARPRKWVTEADLQRQGTRGAGWCELEPQLQLLYSLDALAGNEGRTTASIVYDADDWLVYSTSFAQAFGTRRGLPAYLEARPPKPGAELRRRLAALDDAALSTALGELLDARQRKAILQRRDALLALPTTAEASPASR